MAHDFADGYASGEIGYALAIGEASREACRRIDERYVMDDIARSKVIALVLKVARNQVRSGQYLFTKTEIDTIARLAVQRFIQLMSRRRD